MSANRSVQAAQRRRAGPTNSEPGIPGRGPQPSINSAQMFANQAKTGSGPNIPTGRLAGQQAAKQMLNQSNGSQNDKLSSVNKMTIPQAITLITLRLGAIESKLMHSNLRQGSCLDGESGIDPDFLQSIMSRIESLENRQVSTTSGGVSSTDVNVLKQQFETLKQAVIQSKTTSTNLVKENTSLKNQIEYLTKELTETKELVAVLQNLTMDNSQKILELSMESNGEGLELDETLIDKIGDGFGDGFGNEIGNEMNLNNSSELTELQNENKQTIISGTNLKSLIESELHI